MTTKTDLISCVKDLYNAGLTTSVSGNHSVLNGDWMWITPSGMPRYMMATADLVRVNVRTGKESGKRKASIEKNMHRAVYQSHSKIRAIVHTHSPYTIAVSISSDFRHVIEETRIVVGMPSVISNKPSGSDALAKAVAEEFNAGARAVIVRNHGVIAAAASIHEARAIVESLEEWSKILTISKLFGGAKHFLDD